MTGEEAHPFQKQTSERSETIPSVQAQAESSRRKEQSTHYESSFLGGWGGGGGGSGWGYEGRLSQAARRSVFAQKVMESDGSSSK